MVRRDCGGDGLNSVFGIATTPMRACCDEEGCGSLDGDGPDAELDGS